MTNSFILLSLFFCRSYGCNNGIWLCWGASCWIPETSYFDSASQSESQVVTMSGSVIAFVTGRYGLWVWADCYSSSGLYNPDPYFVWDGETKYTGTSGKAEANWDLVKDFRYQFYARPESNYRYIKMELQLSWPGQALTYVTPSSRYVQDCQISGCRNTELAREPFACQPSPSPSRGRAVILRSPSAPRTASI
jgi:hypothetical protein